MAVQWLGWMPQKTISPKTDAMRLLLQKRGQDIQKQIAEMTVSEQRANRERLERRQAYDAFIATIDMLRTLPPEQRDLYRGTPKLVAKAKEIDWPVDEIGAIVGDPEDRIATVPNRGVYFVNPITGRVVKALDLETLETKVNTGIATPEEEARYLDLMAKMTEIAARGRAEPETRTYTDPKTGAKVREVKQPDGTWRRIRTVAADAATEVRKFLQGSQFVQRNALTGAIIIPTEESARRQIIESFRRELPVFKKKGLDPDELWTELSIQLGGGVPEARPRATSQEGTAAKEEGTAMKKEGVPELVVPNDEIGREFGF